MANNTVEKKTIIGGNFLYGFDKIEAARLSRRTEEIDDIIDSLIKDKATEKIFKVLIANGLSKKIITEREDVNNNIKKLDQIEKGLKDKIISMLPETNDIKLSDASVVEKMIIQSISELFDNELLEKVIDILKEKHKDKYTSDMLDCLEDDIRYLYKNTKQMCNELAEEDIKDKAEEVEKKEEIKDTTKEKEEEKNKVDLPNPISSSSVMNVEYFTQPKQLPMDSELLKQQTLQQFKEENKEIISTFPIIKPIDDLMSSINVNYKSVKIDGLVRITPLENMVPSHTVFYVDVNSLLYTKHPKIIIPKSDKKIELGFIIPIDTENKYLDIIRKYVCKELVINDLEAADSILDEVKEFNEIFDISSIDRDDKFDIVKTISEKCKEDLSKALKNDEKARFKLLNYKDKNNFEIISNSTVPEAYNKAAINRKEQIIKVNKGTSSLEVKENKKK